MADNHEVKILYKVNENIISNIDVANEIKYLKILNPKINDLGCNYFQFYKEIKINNYKCDYFGYDIDKKFINLGLTKFPELKKKYKLANIENTNLRMSDISIIADTLEHTEKPEKILKNIIQLF